MKVKNLMFSGARKSWMAGFLGLILAPGLAMTLFVAPAWADDVYPPNIPVVNDQGVVIRDQTWNRGDPGTTSAEWTFNSEPNPLVPLAPDGTSVPLNVGDYNGLDATTGNPVTGPVAIPSAGIVLAENGGWNNPSETDTASILFIIPDCVDDQPQKILQWQSTEPSDNEDLATITAYKDGLTIGGITGQGKGWAEQGSGPSPYHWVFCYNIQPNPDYEELNLPLAPGDTVTEFIVDTTSCPEPSSMALVGIGAIGLLACGCRRRTAKA